MRGRKELTHEEAQRRLDLDGRGYRLAEPYFGSNNKHLMNCAKGHTFMGRPSCYISGNGSCEVCRRYAKVERDILRLETG